MSPHKTCHTHYTASEGYDKSARRILKACDNMYVGCGWTKSEFLKAYSN